MLYICSGMIRSCSTWQYDIVKEILVSKNLAKPDGFIVKENVNDIINKSENLIYKVHEAMPESIEAARQGKAKIIYIHRDLRDVAASLMVRFRKSLQNVLDDKYISNAYRDYKLWTSLDDVLVQEYHKVMNDMPKAIREIADFLGIQLPESEVTRLSIIYSLEKQKEVVNKLPGSSPSGKLIRKIRRRTANFLYNGIGKRNTQKIAKIFGKVGVSQYDPNTGLHNDHINTGEIGSYKKTMNDKEIEQIETYIKQLTN
jgi:Sulfotransferase domain